MPDGGGRHGGERESVDSRLLLWESLSRGRVSKGVCGFCWWIRGTYWGSIRYFFVSRSLTIEIVQAVVPCRRQATKALSPVTKNAVKEQSRP